MAEVEVEIYNKKISRFLFLHFLKKITAHTVHLFICICFKTLKPSNHPS